MEGVKTMTSCAVVVRNTLFGDIGASGVDSMPLITHYIAKRGVLVSQHSKGSLQAGGPPHIGHDSPSGLARSESPILVFEPEEPYDCCTIDP